jgi:hypothetical protein
VNVSYVVTSFKGSGTSARWLCLGNATNLDVTTRLYVAHDDTGMNLDVDFS